MATKIAKSSLKDIVESLTEIYQPIYNHPELSKNISRDSKDRLESIISIYNSLVKRIQRPLRILDLGSAQGYFSFSLAEIGATVTGVDYLNENIAVCKKLALEFDKLDVSFHVRRIEDFLPTIEKGQYDLVLGLSVFHHMIHEHGVSFTVGMLSDLADKIDTGIFEIAQSSEPMYWAESQPEDSVLLQNFDFTQEISNYGTHLSEVLRPMYFSSNKFWCVNGEIEYFDIATSSSHCFENKAHMDSRQYFFNNEYFLKKYKLKNDNGKSNKVDYKNEVEFLQNTQIDFEIPKLISYGNSEKEAWILRSKFEGKILSDMILNGESYDSEKVIEGILKQLVSLEKLDLFHNDIRTWNVLIKTDGQSTLIDYGSISPKAADCIWPENLIISFAHLVYEIVNGTISDTSSGRELKISPLYLKGKYKTWMSAFWVKSENEWSFQLLYELFLKKDNELVDFHISEDVLPRWLFILEEACNTINKKTARESELNKSSHFWWIESEKFKNEIEIYKNEIEIYKNEIEIYKEEKEKELEVLHKKNDELNNISKNLKDELKLVYKSRSWRSTYLLRKFYQFIKNIGFFFRFIKFFKYILKRYIRISFYHINRYPNIKWKLKNVLIKYPRIYKRLVLIVHNGDVGTEVSVHRESNYDLFKNDSYFNKPLTIEPCFPSPKGKRFLYYFVDHTCLCPVNTGMQRVTRKLAKTLLDEGENIIFVKWDAIHQKIALLNQKELKHLSKWNGPKICKDFISIYPASDTEKQSFIDKHNINEANCLVVPEVTHITYHKKPVTLEIIMAAKKANLKTVFIYYDSIPLKRKELKDMSSNHASYMQHLLLVDLIIPISEWSRKDLISYFKNHEYSSEKNFPITKTILLPGESSLSERATKDLKIKSFDKLILSVGSIEKRKNQLSLVYAFEKYCKYYPDSEWELLLVGNIHEDVAKNIYKVVNSCKKIKILSGISDEDLENYYKKCSFTVFPSKEEGFGLPIMESLWHGKPCVCANFGAMKEVAKGGGCYMVNTREPELIFDAISKLINEPNYREELSKEAILRKIETWLDYGKRFIGKIDEISNPLARIGTIYYFVDHTCSYPSNSGIQRVVRSIAKSLMNNNLQLVPVKWDEINMKFYSVSENEKLFLSKWNGPDTGMWSKWIEPQDIKITDWLLVSELTRNQTSDILKYAKKIGLRSAYVFYDAIPFKMKDFYSQDERKVHETYMKSLNNCEKVFPISKFSTNDLISFLGSSKLHTPLLEERIQTCSLPGEFPENKRILEIKNNTSKRITILCVGTIEPRKNHITLLNAFKKIKKQTAFSVNLVLAGGDVYPDLTKEINNFINTDPDIRWEKSPDDTRLQELYSACDFTVYPSLEEGFGLPILESLWNARPCICRNSGAMKEVAEDGGCLMVDTSSSDLLAACILKLIEDNDLRCDLAKTATKLKFKTWFDYGKELVKNLVDERVTHIKQDLPETLTNDNFYKEMVNIKRRPLLSICISTYNRSAWVDVSLRNLSRLLPDYNTDIEIVICDNASTDDTSDIVKPFLSRKDFSYYSNPVNVGMLGNLRITANHAAGKYIWILGDDDLIRPECIEKISKIIRDNPDLALIYLNYSYTREEDASLVVDFEKFMDEAIPITEPTKDFKGKIREISTNSENFFTAIYCLGFRRDHAIKAYSQNTSGRPFSTMLTCIPTTYYVLNHMMDEPGYWLGEPQIVVNMNVSWMKYAPIWVLERLPEAHDLAEKMGADENKMDIHRAKHLSNVAHWFCEIYREDKENNLKYFSPKRLIYRSNHLNNFHDIAGILSECYKPDKINSKLIIK